MEPEALSSYLLESEDDYFDTAQPKAIWPSKAARRSGHNTGQPRAASLLGSARRDTTQQELCCNFSASTL